MSFCDFQSRLMPKYWPWRYLDLGMDPMPPFLTLFGVRGKGQVSKRIARVH